jgi:hypothetical protein
MRLLDDMTVDRRVARMLRDQKIEPIHDHGLNGWAAIRVTADDAWRLYWQDDAGAVDQYADYGPLRMPYPTMWIEGRIPTRCYGIDGWVATPPERAGVMLMEGPDAPRDILMAYAVMKTDGDVALSPAVMGRVILDEQYRAEGVGWIYVAGDPTPGDPFESVPGLAAHEQADDPLVQLAQDALRPALLALSLMNCRNVGLEEVAPHPAAVVRRYEKRHGFKPLRFSKIVLPRPKAGQSMGSAVGGTKSLHLVRGHFATYTDENKLFGKHTGTFWREWHVAGDRQKGVVIPSYEVGAA